MICRRLLLWTVALYTMATLAAGSMGQYDPEQWPRVSLSFVEGGTLGDIFAAGIRPYRFPGLERSLLEAKHYRVTVTQGDGSTLPEFPAELIEITPLQGGLLSSLTMIRYKATLEEARGFMLPYLSKERRSAQELDRYLAAVKADHLDYNGMGRGVEDFGVRWSDAGGPRYVVFFRKAFDQTRPLIFSMMIDWSQIRTPRQSRSFYKEPVPPPPGFGDVSMQAPEKFGPDSQVDILVAQGKAIAGDRQPAGAPSSEGSTPAPSFPIATPAPKTIESPSPAIGRRMSVLLWVMGILVLLALVAVALKRRL